MRLSLTHGHRRSPAGRLSRLAPAEAASRIAATRRAGSLRRRAGSRPGRRACAHAREPGANARRAIAIGQHRDRLARHGLRRERVLDQLGHDRLAGNQVHHPDGVERHDAARELIRERRHAIDDRPSACRAAPPARSRCPRRSARRRPTPARCRCRPRRREPRPPVVGADRVEQLVVEMRRARDDELRAGHLAAESAVPRPRGRAGCATPRSAGCRAESRRSARTASGPGRARNASRVADGFARSISGCPTNSTGTPPFS